MGTTLTARVSDKLNEELDKISEEEKLDKSAVARRLLEDAVKEHKIEKALEKYGKGEVTVRKAAEIADISYRKFLSLMKENGVEFQYKEKDLEEDIEALK